jgi:hypothetical protein
VADEHVENGLSHEEAVIVFFLESSQANDTTTGKFPAIPTGGIFQGQPRSRLHDRDTVSREADRNGEQPGLILAVAAAQAG